MRVCRAGATGHAALRGTTRMSDAGSSVHSGRAREGRCTGVYRRRRPERTILYQVVQCHLESWLAQHREADPDHDPVPWYVEEEFRRYLDCGVLCRGVALARCKGCGHDYLLAFSCSTRGVCPSCTTRHMAETAAHLVDHVFPQVPVAAPAHPALAALMHPCMSRQWVLALPKRLRYFVHRDAELAGRVLSVWLRALEQRLRTRSPGAPASARLGAVSFI